jgi:hypothetical protein
VTVLFVKETSKTQRPFVEVTFQCLACEKHLHDNYIVFFISYILSYISFLSQIRTLDFKRHMSFSFCFVFNTLKWEVIVRFFNLCWWNCWTLLFKYSFIISIYVFSDTCGGYYASLTGAFSSPNYPGDYPNNADCRYIIIVPVNHYITLSFQTFNTESGYDYVKVRNIRYIDIYLSCNVWLNFDLYRKFACIWTVFISFWPS